MERIVKGIWIPIEIWTAEDLSWNEKILLMEIDSFTSKGVDCYISNEYVSKMLGVNETNASRVMSSLIKKGYVVKTGFDGRRRFVESTIGYAKPEPVQDAADIDRGDITSGGSTKAALVKSANKGCQNRQSRSITYKEITDTTPYKKEIYPLRGYTKKENPHEFSEPSSQPKNPAPGAAPSMAAAPVPAADSGRPVFPPFTLSSSSVERSACGFDPDRMAERKKEKLGHELDRVASGILTADQRRRFLDWYGQHAPGKDTVKAERDPDFNVRTKALMWAEEDARRSAERKGGTEQRRETRYSRPEDLI